MEVRSRLRSYPMIHGFDSGRVYFSLHFTDMSGEHFVIGHSVWGSDADFFRSLDQVSPIQILITLIII